MKKLFLIIAVLSCCGIFNLIAQEKIRYENTTWRVIRERLFNGDNSKAYRYEEDIRIQLLGAKNSSDSLLTIDLIKDLNDLIQTVEVRMVSKDGNMIINLSPDFGILNRNNQKSINYKIISTQIDLNLDGLNSPELKKKEFYYYTFRQLTKLYNPQNGSTRYDGIFDLDNVPQILMNEIDKDLIRKLYSNDFYKGLRENTIKERGFLNYLDLRYHYPLLYISTLLGIMLSILGFFYLVSKQSYTKTKIKFGEYFKKSVVILFGISVIYLLFTLPQTLSHSIGSRAYFSFILSTIVTVFIDGLIIVTLIFFLERFIKQKTVDFKQRQFLFFISTTFSILFAWFISTQIALFLYNEFSVYPIKIPLHFSYTTLFVAFIISSLRVFFNFINYRVQSMVNQKDVELARMKELKNQAELNALHSRINPHFLYNSLNSIAGLAHTDPDKTENMATSLSELFRYSINKEDKTYVTVDDELEMVRKYLEIEKVRFGEKLAYEIEVEEGTGEKQVPKFLIQPLVENAVKHGLSKITGKGILKIIVGREGGDLIIRVYDNGPDFPQELISGYGLQNLYDKLKILYGEEAILNWQNGENKHIQVTLKNQFRS